VPFHLVAPDVFAELHGFVLVNPRRLDALTGGARGDLLTPFSETALGDRVCEDGAVVPVLDITANDYDVAVRDAPPTILTTLRKSSPGWTLNVDDRPLVLCGVGYLVNWNPGLRGHRRISVPAGAYEVEIRGGEVAPDKWGVEFVLTRAPKPKYAADPARAFDMHLDLVTP
jgi:hypothetical protein